MSDQATTYFTRSDVVTEEERAWALDDRFRVYVFDGTRFWRRRKHSTHYETVPSWKAPASGWMHAAGCGCHLCGGERHRMPAAA